jgi:hypothetical protein
LEKKKEKRKKREPLLGQSGVAEPMARKKK